MGLEHGEHHREPARVPPHHRPARRCERSRRHQRLQFHQHRAGALDAGEDGCPRTTEVAFGEKQFGRIGDFAQA